MTRDTKRRSFLKYAAVGAVAGLAGCTRGGSGGSGGSNGSGGSRGTSGSGGTSGGSGSNDLEIPLSKYQNADIKWQKNSGKQINIGAVNHPWVDSIKPLVPVFEQLTGIDVVWNVLPEEKFRTKRLTDVSTGAGKFDVFFLDQVVNQFRKSGWLQALDTYFNDSSLFDKGWYKTNDLFEVTRKVGHGAGRSDTWTGLPITVEVLTTFYRKDLYQKHDLSVPKTTDELEQNAKVIDNKENGVVGGVGRGQKGYGMNIYIMNAWIREWGKSLWKNFPSNSNLDTPAAIDAGEYYVGLLKNYGPASAASMTWSDAVSSFQQGKAGHIFSDANLFWGDLTDPSQSNVANKVGVAKMPTPQTKGGTFAPNSFSWQLATSQAASNSEAAFQFMLWATSPPTQQYMGVQDAAPFMTRESVWSNDDFKQAVGKEFANVSLSSLKSAKGDPFDAKYPDWGQKYSVELQNAIAGKESVESAFKKAASEAESTAGSN